MRVFLLLFTFFSPCLFADPLFYFSVGLEWKYQVEGDDKRVVTNAVTDVKTVKGRNWYKLEEYGETFWVGNSSLGQVEAIDFFEGDPGQLDEPEEVLIFKFPAKVGEIWYNVDSPTSYDGVKTLTVPAGTFNCHMYTINMGNGDYSKSCIAKDVGVVFNEAVLEGGLKEISKLISYK